VDAVLGLSVTPSAVGLVLVEGQDADGATMDRDAFEVRSRGRSSALQTSEKAAAAVMRSEAIAATRGHRLHSIGVTWSDDADAEASLLLKSLSDSGFDNVVPVRLPEATEALARGIAEVIGYGTTAVCVLEPDTVIALIVHTRDGAVQTAVNHAIVTEEDLIRWLSAVFTRANWQPEALVMVGSGGDDELMPILEDALSVPVFAPAEAQLALARGAALASAQNVDFAFSDEAHAVDERHALGRRRRQLGQAGPLALLVAGVLTFTVSASVAVSLQLAPKKDVAASEPRPAAKTSPETPAAATHYAPPIAIPPAPVVEAPPSPEAPPVEAAPPPVYSETPVSIPDAPVAVSDAPPVEGVPPEAPAAPPPPLPPEQLAPPIAPAPVERPGIMSRIRDRLHGGGRDDEVQPAPEVGPPPAPAAELAPPPPPAPEAAPPPPPEAPPLLPPA
jgi:nucleoside 2-deoxyribosyltransferase